MNDETIVAIYDTAEHASAAVRDLESAGIPTSAISQHSGTSTGVTGVGSSSVGGTHEQGFWASLFGGEPKHGHDTAVYDRSLQGGSTVVTVRGSSEHHDDVLAILERHHPVDIDERAQSYGLSQTATATTGLTATETATTEPVVDRDPGTIQLSEEQLVVGKRAVNRGTTRIRRYVVETPAEAQVSLHEERVTVERRPVTDGRPVSNADFTDKVIEVTETAEEAVVGKEAHVREEVVIRKDASDRIETVHDTVRREDVEITKDAGTVSPAAGSTRDSVGAVGSVGTTSPYKPSI